MTECTLPTCAYLLADPVMCSRIRVFRDNHTVQQTDVADEQFLGTSLGSIAPVEIFRTPYRRPRVRVATPSLADTIAVRGNKIACLILLLYFRVTRSSSFSAPKGILRPVWCHLCSVP